MNTSRVPNLDASKLTRLGKVNSRYRLPHDNPG
jgi:hypothetical protein